MALPLIPDISLFPKFCFIPIPILMCQSRDILGSEATVPNIPHYPAEVMDEYYIMEAPRWHPLARAITQRCPERRSSLSVSDHNVYCAGLLPLKPPINPRASQRRYKRGTYISCSSSHRASGPLFYIPKNDSGRHSTLQACQTTLYLSPTSESGRYTIFAQIHTQIL